MQPIRAFLALTVLLLAAGHGRAGPLDIWHWRSPTSTGAQLYGVGASSNLFVAVGEQTTIVVSANGLDWRTVHAGGTIPLRAVAYGDGRWVAVGDFGAVFTSTDSETWTQQANPYFYDLRGVTWGNGMFVAVGDQTTILTSPDGVTWTRQTFGDEPLTCVTWGNGVFLACGGQPAKEGTPANSSDPDLRGRPLLLTSVDGQRWDSRGLPIPGQVTSVVFAENRFLLATDNGRVAISSNDPYSWRAALENFQWFAPNPFPLTVGWVDGRFVVLANNSRSSFISYFSSEDGDAWQGRNWRISPPAFVPRALAVASNAQGLALVGAEIYFTTFRARLLFTSDAQSWRNVATIAENSWAQRLGEANGRVFSGPDAQGFDPNAYTQYRSSPDGQNWEVSNLPVPGHFTLPAYGAGTYVAARTGGTELAVSTNGHHWALVASGITNVLRTVRFGGGQFVALTDGGIIAASTNGLNWQAHALPGTNQLTDIAWHAGTYLILPVPNLIQTWPPSAPGSPFPPFPQMVPEPPFLFRSKNLVEWQRQPLATNITELKQVLAWNGGFALLTGGAGLLRSDDGLTWNPDQPPGDPPGYLAGAEQLLAFRYNASRTFSSRTANDTSWSAHTLPWFTGSGNTAYWAPRDAVFVQRTWLVGSMSVLQSDPLEPTPPEIISQPAAIANDEAAWVSAYPGVVGTSPLHYQWLRDGLPVSGANAHTLTLPAGEFPAHQYTLRVSNSTGVATSVAIQVVVAQPPRLSVNTDLRQLRLTGTPGAVYALSDSTDVSNTVIADGTIIILPAGVWNWTVRAKLQTSAAGGEAFFPMLETSEVPIRFWKAEAVP
jgi:hypothetical protein